MKKKANLNDVAREAGVSAMTVSRVINNHPRIKEETINKVKAAIKKLNYSSMPSPHKRGRPSRAHKGIHTGQVAVVPLGFNEDIMQNPIISSTIMGIQKTLQSKNIQMFITPINDLAKLPDILDKRSIDGIIMLGALPDEDFNGEILKIPTVMVYQMSSQTPETPWYDEVVPDNHQVGVMAAKQLLANGHTNAAFIDSSGGHPEFVKRGKSFEKEMRANGANVHMLRAESQQERLEPDVNRQLTDKLLTQLLELTPRPTAIFLPSDLVTAIVYRKLREKGACPGDFEIISCNAEKPFLEGLYPVPQSIDICAEEIGQQSVEQLVWRLAHRDNPRKVTLVTPADLK